MAKKDKPTETASKAVGRQIAFRLPSDLTASLDAFLAAQRVQPTQTDTMIVALQEFLLKEGFYPPKPAPKK